jgi:hypothetical protein
MLCEDTNFHVACTSNPDMSLESVKHSPDWSCDGRMVGRVQKRVSPEFSTRWFVSCVRTQVHMTVCFFVLICLHAPLRTWTTNELRPSLHTQVHEEYTHFWRKMVPRMTQRRFHMSWRYQCSVAFTGHSDGTFGQCGNHVTYNLSVFLCPLPVRRFLPPHHQEHNDIEGDSTEDSCSPCEWRFDT